MIQRKEIGKGNVTSHNDHRRRLVQGGCDVGFAARGAQLAALRQHGLRVESELGQIHLPQVRASADPAELGPPNVVLLCVKLWDTASAARAAVPIVGPETMVISLQNGARKEETLRQIFGDQAVVGGVCYVAAKILRPGVIRQTGRM